MADITYDLIKDTASFNHIPILTLDKRWYLLVPEVSKTDEIKYWEKKVNDLLKKQGQVTNDLKEVKFRMSLKIWKKTAMIFVVRNV